MSPNRLTTPIIKTNRKAEEDMARMSGGVGKQPILVQNEILRDQAAAGRLASARNAPRPAAITPTATTTTNQMDATEIDCRYDRTAATCRAR